MAHNRKLVLGGVGLTRARLPARQTALAIGKARDELEQEMMQSAFLNNAPFTWVGLVIRQGIKDDATPEYKKIDVNDGELPISIEVDTNRLVGASAEQSLNVYRHATLLALLHVGEKFHLNVARIRTLLAEAESQSANAG